MKLLTILFVSLWLWPFAAQAQCPTMPEPNVKVDIFFETLTYDFNKSFKQLKAIADIEWLSAIKPDQPLGLAVSQMVLENKSSLQTTEVAPGVFCVSAIGLDLNFGFKKPTIYVVREFPRRSCPHREVLAHEEIHIEIDRKLLRDYRLRLQKSLSAIVKDIGVIQGDNPNHIQQRYNEELNKRIAAIGEQLRAERQRRNSLHDSPEEYARIGTACNGQLAEIVKRHLGDTDGIGF